MERIKILKIFRCDDTIAGCPYFKRIHHCDYSDECTCTLYEKDIPQFKNDENEYGEDDDFDNEWTVPDEYGFIGGQFPKWCPLENSEDYDHYRRLCL